MPLHIKLFQRLSPNFWDLQTLQMQTGQTVKVLLQKLLSFAAKPSTVFEIILDAAVEYARWNLILYHDIAVYNNQVAV